MIMLYYIYAMFKVVMHKSHGKVSLVEQSTIEYVGYLKFVFKGVFSKPSGKYIVGQNLCFLR